MEREAIQSAHVLLASTYKHFNARDVDSVLKNMHKNVDWPNGMEGGRINGHDAVREYWTRQWSVLDPHVEPVSFAAESDGLTEIRARTRSWMACSSGETPATWTLATWVMMSAQ